MSIAIPTSSLPMIPPIPKAFLLIVVVALPLT